MAQTITLDRDTQDALLADLTGAGAVFEAPTVDLIDEDWTPSPEVDPASLSVPSGTEFPGYATSTAVTWTATPVNLQSGDRALIGTEKVFLATADPPSGLVIYGFRLNGAGGAVLVHWDTPRAVTRASDFVVVDPYLIIGQGTISPIEGV